MNMGASRSSLFSNFSCIAAGALFTATSLFCGMSAADDTEIFFAAERDSVQSEPNVMFMFDTSGSMTSTDGSGVQRIHRLKRAMVDVLETTENVRIGIGAFSGISQGGAIRLPTVGLDDDMCPDATCNELSVRAAVVDVNDDGFENGVGNVQLNGETTTIFDEDAYHAFRFQNLNIPRGATINSAKLELSTSDNQSTFSTVVEVVAENVDHSESLSSSNTNISTRYNTLGGITEEKVNWTVKDWNQFMVNRTDYSPNIGGVISEVVNRDGWCGGNALTVILKGSGYREFRTRDYAVETAPVLHVNYDPSSVEFSSTCLRSTAKSSIDSGLGDVSEDSVSNAVDASNETLLTHIAGNRQKIGLRFPSLDVPQGSTITDARLRLYSAGSIDGTVDLNIKVENSSHANIIDSSISGALSARDFHASSVDWVSVPARDSDSSVMSPNIKSLVNSVVSGGEWNSGNAIAFVLEASALSSGVRMFHSRNSTKPAAQLIVHYQNNGSSAMASSTPVLQTGRDKLIQTIHELRADGWTPLVDMLYEASQYMRGQPVVYGKQRGAQEHDDVYHRLSAPSSYTGATGVFRPEGCDPLQLDSDACVGEEITGPATYIAPAFDECKANQIVLLSDGAAIKNTSKELVKQLPGITSCGARTNVDEECGIELAEWLFTNDHDDSQTGDQTIVTNTIGFEFSAPFLSTMAGVGGGRFYPAASASELTNVFNSIIQSAITQSTNFVAPGSSASRTNNLVNSNEVYFGVFKPDTDSNWDGNLKRFELALNTETDEVEMIDALAVPAIQASTGDIKETARSYWSASVDGNEAGSGGAASKLPTTRNLVTSIYNTTASAISMYNLHEDTTQITKTMLGITGSDDAYRTEVLQWARGVDLKDFDNDGDITEIRTQLGDPMHSTQHIMHYPSDDASVDAKSLIYFATNHGFLHAINTSNGVEEFGYIPEELLDNLSFYYQNNAVSSDERMYGLDGEVSGWHNDTNNNGLIETSEDAYIYVGMRRGGRSYYALDVSDPSNPTLAWQIQGGATGDFTELGQTWSRPIKTKIKYLGDEKDVLVFAAGYDDANDSEKQRAVDTVGRGFFIVDASTGALIAHRDSDDFSSMDYSIPSDLRIVDLNGDGYMDLIYVGDTGGQIWRFDINNQATTDAAFITGAVVASFGGVGVPHNVHFFYEPDLSLLRAENGASFLNVAIGSGSRPSPNSKKVNDTFYSFRDLNVFGPPTDSDGNISYPSAYEENDLLNVSKKLGSTDNSGKLDKGWFFRLPEDGEKVLSSAITLDSELLFTTYVPEGGSTTNACSVALGGGRVYSVNAFNGDPADGSSVLSDRYSELVTPGIPPRVSALIVEAAPNQITKFVGKEALSDDKKSEPFKRTFWAEH